MVTVFFVFERLPGITSGTNSKGLVNLDPPPFPTEMEAETETQINYFYHDDIRPTVKTILHYYF